MARIARVVVGGHPHHLTQTGVRSIAIFRHDGDRQTYLAFMAEETQRLDVEVLAYCLLRKQLNLVLLPQDADGLARAVGNAHRRYTRTRNFAEGVRGYLFQGRFSSCVLDERHLLAAVRYVETLPVRDRTVKKPEEFAWSSARFHLGLRKSDPLVSDRRLRGLVKNWRQFLREDDPEAEKTLDLCTRTGRPAGTPEFVARMEHLTGRRLRRGRPGPKPKGRKG
jgi:putative transposase